MPEQRGGILWPTGSAAALLLPRLERISGFEALAYRQVEVRDTSDAVTVSIKVPSEQLTRVADTFFAVDAAVRRATALLDGYLPQGGSYLPLVSPEEGGLELLELSFGSAHARTRLHARSRDNASEGRALLLGLLVSVIANIGNDYLAPDLPADHPGHTDPPPLVFHVTDNQPDHSQSITVTVPDGPYPGAPPRMRSAPGSQFTTTIVTPSGDTIVITSPIHR